MDLHGKIMNRPGQGVTRVLRIPSEQEFGEDLLFILSPDLPASDQEIYDQALGIVQRFNREDAKNDGECDDGRSVMENVRDALAEIGIVPATVLNARFMWDGDYGGGSDDVPGDTHVGSHAGEVPR